MPRISHSTRYDASTSFASVSSVEEYAQSQLTPEAVREAEQLAKEALLSTTPAAQRLV